MPYTRNHASIIAPLAVCAVFIALISFFLPLISIELFDIKESLSGFNSALNALDAMEFPSLGIPLSLACTAISLIVSLVAIKSPKAGIGTILTSAAGMVFLLLPMLEGNDFFTAMDFAGVGFYLYECASLAAIIFSVAMLIVSQSSSSASFDADISAPSYTPKATPAPTYVPKATPTYAPKATPASTPAKQLCANCKAELVPGASFCRSCGTPVKKAAPTAPDKPLCANCKAELVPGASFCRSCGTPVKKAAPAAPDKPLCANCKAELVPGASFCRSCGTPVKKDDAEPFSSPVMTPTPGPGVSPVPKDKSGRTAICPYCGARQREDVTKCKYCGTPMK